MNKFFQKIFENIEKLNSKVVSYEKIAKNKLLKFILGLKTATQAEKAKLAQICGFEVKNGKIISQTPFNVNK